jgi:hypothetical protein
MKKLVNDEEYFKKLKQKSIEYKCPFSWPNAAAKLKEAYNQSRYATGMGNNNNHTGTVVSDDGSLPAEDIFI